MQGRVTIGLNLSFTDEFDIGIFPVRSSFLFFDLYYCFVRLSSFCSALLVTNLAPTRTSGTPFPGRLLAPQNKTFDMPEDSGPGRVMLS